MHKNKFYKDFILKCGFNLNSYKITIFEYTAIVKIILLID